MNNQKINNDVQIVGFDYDRKLLKKFIDYGYTVYKDDKEFIAPSYKQIEWELSADNPFMDNGTVKKFIVTDNGNVCGRIAAMIDQKNNKGLVGFFEVENSYLYAEKLLDAALEYIVSKDINTITGPVNFSTWNKYRFVSAGSSEKTFMMEPYNHIYYNEFFVRYGFHEIKRYYSNIINDIDVEMSKIERFKGRAERNGYYIRKIDVKRLDEELDLLYRLTVEIFKENYSYTDIDKLSFTKSYSGLRGIIKPDYLLFLYNNKDIPCGFIFTMPDYSEAIRSMKAKGGFIEKLFFLKNKKKADRFIMKTLGVTQQARGSGGGSLLMYSAYRLIKESGYKNSIHALMISDNGSRKYGMGTTDIIREYSLYEYTIGK